MGPKEGLLELTKIRALADDGSERGSVVDDSKSNPFSRAWVRKRVGRGGVDCGQRKSVCVSFVGFY